jgi:hypothetical protein
VNIIKFENYKKGWDVLTFKDHLFTYSNLRITFDEDLKSIDISHGLKSNNISFYYKQRQTYNKLNQQVTKHGYTY